MFIIQSNKTDKNSAEFYKAKFDGLNLNEYKNLIKKVLQTDEFELRRLFN